MSIKVMSWVWDNVEIKGAELIMMLALADNANDDGVCWPSIATLQHKTRYASSNGVRNCIKRCEQQGVLAVAEKPGTSNRYIMTAYRVSRGLPAVPSDLDARDISPTPSVQSEGVQDISTPSVQSEGVPLQSRVKPPPSVQSEGEPSVNHQLNLSAANAASEVFADYRSTIGRFYAWGDKAARSLTLYHVLQGSSKKHKACNCDPPVSLDEFKRFITAWPKHLHAPESPEVLQKEIYKFRLKAAPANNRAMDDLAAQAAADSAHWSRNGSR